MITETELDLKRGTKRKSRTIAAYFEGVAYNIFTFENPKGEQTVADLTSLYPWITSGRPSDREVSVNGFRGKEFRFQFADLTGIAWFHDC
jgi:hypothetical protein